MNCQQIRFTIVESLGQEIQLAPEVESHLLTCAACSQFCEEEKQLETLLGAAAFQLEPPGRIWTRIESTIADRSGERFDWDWRSLARLLQVPAWRGAAATLGLLLVVSLSLLRFGSGPVEPAALAQVDAYQLHVEGNPFRPLSGEENPFLDLTAGLEGNPFNVNGSPQ